MFQSTPSAREGDLDPHQNRWEVAEFQSTPSAREGDPTETPYALPVRVSIHAFREGRRHDPWFPECRRRSFNPRLPRGKATDRDTVRIASQGFQSTPSAREGDHYEVAHQHVLAMFQSTPSAREGDASRTDNLHYHSCFNPRLPRGKATFLYQSNQVATWFQSTPSAREGDSCWGRALPQPSCFNPRLPRGKAT